MKTILFRTAHGPRHASSGIVLLAFLPAILVGSTAALAQDPDARVVRVEEDWELVVETPHSNTVAPQVVCVFSPFSHVESVHATLELNHQNIPDFAPGGLQLQIWDGENPLHSRKFPNAAVMNQMGETVTWTQVLALDDGVLTFEIINGHSQTWGTFGGQGYLRAETAIDLANLNGYNPSVSVTNSGVSYAANLVQSLVLKRVRLITADGEVLEDASERPVQ